MEKEIKLGTIVSFDWLGHMHFGKLMSVEQGVCNIRGLEQGKRERAAYHPRLDEIREATQEEVIRLLGQ